MRSNRRARWVVVAAALVGALLQGSQAAAGPQVAAAHAMTPRYEFQGHVYEGRPRERPRYPLPGVTVALWGSNSLSRMGTLLDSTVTDENGSFYLSTPDLAWTFYSLIETDPPGFVSTGAVAGTVGRVQDHNWIYYQQFLNVTLYDGNEFYDEPAIRPSATPSVTPTPTRTNTPTRTPTPLRPTATRTQAKTATPTPTMPTPMPAPLVVNTTADHDDGSCVPLGGGDCALREAMRLANERSGPDTILFDIPTADPGHNPDTHQWTIRPQNPLPPLVDAGTRIDGGVGGGQAPVSALSPACGGSGKIVINFSSSGGGFVANGANGVLTLLTIIGGPDMPAVIIGGASGYGNQVYCNTIRGSASGGAYHVWEGVKITTGAHDNLIDANTIDNCSAGVLITGGAHHNAVERNWIGGLASGALPNRNAGVTIDGGAHHNTVGHASLVARGNVISGNTGPGVVIAGQGTYYNVVAHNRIGLQPASDQPRANSGPGVQLAQQAGGNTIGPGNVIACNTGDGVTFGGTGALPGPNVVTWNSTYDNGGLGIRNPRLAPPVISSASLSPGDD